MRDHFTTERTSLVIDDLVVGRSYEFITPRGHVYRGEWAGIHERQWGVLHIPAGGFALYPHGVTRIHLVRAWARCTITAIEPPGCPACECACDLSDATVTITPLPQSDMTVLRATWPVVLGCVVVWCAGIAWVVWHVWQRV
jgi:hypothetical protein